MGYSKKDIQRALQDVSVGVGLCTGTLDGTTTTEIIQLGGACSKCTWQGDTGLTGTVEFSTNGKTWYGSAAIATTPTSYNTHNFNSIKVTRSGGTGKVAVSCTA